VESWLCDVYKALFVQWRGTFEVVVAFGTDANISGCLFLNTIELPIGLRQSLQRTTRPTPLITIKHGIPAMIYSHPAFESFFSAIVVGLCLSSQKAIVETLSGVRFNQFFYFHLSRPSHRLKRSTNGFIWHFDIDFKVLVIFYLNALLLFAQISPVHFFLNVWVSCESSFVLELIKNIAFLKKFLTGYNLLPRALA